MDGIEGVYVADGLQVPAALSASAAGRHWPRLTAPPATGMYLRFDSHGLALAAADGRKRPLLIRSEHAAGPQGWRLRHARLGAEPLARACGLGKGWRPDVVDATAGLGHDGLVLACLGASVTLIEQHPVVAALLADGVRRASLAASLTAATGRVQQHQGAAEQWLTSNTAPSIVYMDPMFPPSRGGAPGKQMALLQRLIGDSAAPAALLECARRHVRHAVVVKRRRHAAPLAEGPHHALVGKAIRFDVYQPHSNKAYAL